MIKAIKGFIFRQRKNFKHSFDSCTEVYLECDLMPMCRCEACVRVIRWEAERAVVRR